MPSSHSCIAYSPPLPELPAAVVAPTQPSLGVVKLAALTFFAVSGGPFGLEPLIKNGGARNALLGLVVIPWVWGLPMALMTAELSTALPESGGYIVWLHRAFGDFWALQASVWTVCNSFLDNAGYPIMFVDYLMEYQARAWESVVEVNATAHNKTLLEEVKSEDGWGMGAQWLVGMVMLVPICAVNMRGAGAAADGALGFGLLVIAPVLVMVAIGLPSVNSAGVSAPPNELSKNWGGFLTVLLWNNCGFDSAGTVAAEVKNPGKVYMPAMCLCILLCIIVYALPTIVGVCAGTDGLTDVTKWDDGYWTVIGAHIGGGWLAAWMTFAGAVSSCGLLCTLLCTTSYAMASMGRRGYLPAAVAWARHDGTPYVSILINSAAVCVLMLGDFEAILEANMVTYNLKLVLEFGALLKLRQAEPELPRPYKIPLGMPGLCLLFAPPVALTLALLALASWSTLGIASCVVGLGLLAHAVRGGDRQSSLANRERTGGEAEAEEGEVQARGCPSRMASPKALVSLAVGISLIIGLASVMAQASTEGALSRGPGIDSGSSVQCTALEATFCSRVFEAQGVCPATQGCGVHGSAGGTQDEDGGSSVEIRPSQGAACQCDQHFKTTTADGQQPSAGWIDWLFLLASLGLAALAGWATTTRSKSSPTSMNLGVDSSI